TSCSGHPPDQRRPHKAALGGGVLSAKLNDIDPQAWLADVLARIAGHPASRLDELLPWNWKAQAALSQAA
ncbi:MAG: transposase domain-containing protein, partial [Hyphomonadaceae bacterium]